MKIIKKLPHGNGHICIYFCGVKIASYKPKQFVMGDNNKINVSKNVDLTCRFFGNNNEIIIENTPFGQHIDVCIGSDHLTCNDCKIHIGKNTSIGSLKFMTPLSEDKTMVEIGEDCMFSVGINFLPSDVHSIVDSNGNSTNIGKYIKIGNHVWIGANATICKNTEIADGCVIGTNSVVSGKFTEPNCVLVGNPARVVKRGIKWDRRHPKELLASQK